MSLKTRGILVLVIGTIMGLSLSLGGGVLAGRDRAAPEDAGLRQAELLAEVMERVKSDYVEPIDDATLLESAIRGMVSDLDAHSQFLDENEYLDIRISTTGSYSGVGLEVSTEGDSILIVAPIDDTPAHRAGIRAGDIIVAIDGRTVENEGLQETIRRMRGRAGSNTPWLQHDDAAFRPPVSTQQMKRDTGGFAGPRRRHQHGKGIIAQRVGKLRQHGVNGKGGASVSHSPYILETPHSAKHNCCMV